MVKAEIMRAITRRYRGKLIFNRYEQTTAIKMLERITEIVILLALEEGKREGMIEVGINDNKK